MFVMFRLWKSNVVERYLVAVLLSCCAKVVVVVTRSNSNDSTRSDEIFIFVYQVFNKSFLRKKKTLILNLKWYISI